MQIAWCLQAICSDNDGGGLQLRISPITSAAIVNSKFEMPSPVCQFSIPPCNGVEAAVATKRFHVRISFHAFFTIFSLFVLVAFSTALRRLSSRVAVCHVARLPHYFAFVDGKERGMFQNVRNPLYFSIFLYCIQGWGSS